MTRLLLALALLLLLAPAAEAAKKRSYDVSVEAKHFVGWDFRDPKDPEQCANWERAGGTEMSRIETTKPGRMNVFGKSTAFLVKFPTVTGEYERESTILRHTMPSSCSPCGPTSEYGECAPDTPDRTLEFRCGPKTAKAVGGITAIGGKVRAMLGAAFPSTWDSSEPCPKPIGGPSSEPVNRQLPNVKLPAGAWPAVLKLKRGRKTVLEAVEFRDESGELAPEHCRESIPDGYSECARTAVKVTVKRVR